MSLASRASRPWRPMTSRRGMKRVWSALALRRYLSRKTRHLRKEKVASQSRDCRRASHQIHPLLDRAWTQVTVELRWAMANLDSIHWGRSSLGLARTAENRLLQAINHRWKRADVSKVVKLKTIDRAVFAFELKTKSKSLGSSSHLTWMHRLMARSPHQSYLSVPLTTNLEVKLM